MMPVHSITLSTPVQKRLVCEGGGHRYMYSHNRVGRGAVCHTTAVQYVCVIPWFALLLCTHFSS